ncbi:MAG: uroporphyrinogen-III synthase [Bacteroidota bacterium]|jgi:uroporphyrinogen-III synthase|nr:uroporphyrinogen-III synthase [Bacteroidota bacterium]
MAKKATKNSNVVISKPVKKILIAQPKPESEKSPYFDIEKKYHVQFVFEPFIRLEGITAKEFRKQKIDIATFTAIIFTSRHAIDHFFRICEEMKVSISQDTKYFCITEAVALYLQKFILYRKRKVFYGADGTNKSLFSAINKHKENESFLYVCSENQQDNEIVNWLKNNHCEFQLGFMYRSISNNIKPLFAEHNIDMVCLFTPSAVRSIFDNFPDFHQNGTLIGAFGGNTAKAVEEAGLTLNIKAPDVHIPSMTAAIEHFLATHQPVQ